MEEIIDRLWFHLDGRLLKDPVILKTKRRLDNYQLDNQHGPPLRTKPPIPVIISTDNLTIVSELTPLPNIPSLLSLDLNASEGKAGEIDTYYFQMIRNNYQVKDKYKAGTNKGKKCQKYLKDALKGSTFTYGALYRCGVVILGKYICEYKKEKQKHHDDKHPKVYRNAAKRHQNRLQTYHDLITNKKKQDRSLYTA